MDDYSLIDPLVNDGVQDSVAYTVITDKLDYAPGETATITASGFEVGSTIEFAIQDDPNAPGDDGEADVYQPFSIKDGVTIYDANGKAIGGDLDGVADGQVVTTWLVPTDNNGSGSGIPDALNATLNLAATGNGADGEFGTADDQVAMTTFTDGNQGLWAWRNQPGPTLNTWDAGTTIQQANSIYAEGEVIPFRWTIATGNPAPQLQEGVTYTIQLDWAYAGGTTDPQKLFFDYLTSYNATETTSPAFGPGSGLSAGFLNGYISTKAIPNDTGDTGGTPPNPATVAHPPGNFTLYNIDPNSVTFSPYLVDNVNANQEDRRLEITFTPSDNDNTPNEFLDVGVAWGGHLATQADYGFQNGAASFPGASPQMVVDLNPSVSGDQTNLNINPNAIVPQGQITIIKDAVPNDPQDFGFTITGPTGANITPTFTLDDDSDPTLSNQITFFGLVEGVYTITENSTSGWSLTNITATETGAEDTTTSDIFTPNVGARTATITVANGEVWTTTFTNQVNQNPSLTIVKSLTNADDAVVDTVGETIEYTITVENTGNVDLTGVSLTDTFAGGASLFSGDTNNNNVLETTETWTYTADYVVTQADLNSGADLVNVAVVDTAQTDPQQDDATSTVDQNPALTFDKIVVDSTPGDGKLWNDTNNNGFAEAGETISYEFKVTNTGNVTLTSVTITDPTVTVGTLSDNGDDGFGVLAPGAMEKATGTYVLTAEDIAAAKKINTATADSNQTDPVSDTETVPLPQRNQRSISINDIFGSNINDPTGTTYTKQNNLFVSGTPTKNAIEGGFAITDESNSGNQLDGFLVQLQGVDVDIQYKKGNNWELLDLTGSSLSLWADTDYPDPLINGGQIDQFLGKDSTLENTIVRPTGGEIFDFNPVAVTFDENANILFKMTLGSAAVAQLGGSVGNDSLRLTAEAYIGGRTDQNGIPSVFYYTETFNV